MIHAELFPAAYWDCECGHRNFVEPTDVAEEDDSVVAFDAIVPTVINEDHSGCEYDERATMILVMPGKSKCAKCGQISLLVINPEGIKDDEA